MSGALGFALAAAQLGISAIQIKPQRSMGPFTAYVTIEEVHQDSLEITQHPVDVGAEVSDHSYRRGAQLTLKGGYSDSPTAKGLLDGLASSVTKTITGIQSLVSQNNVSQVKATYEKMLALQNSRVPFAVLTGKREYHNMIMRSLRVTTDVTSSGTLMFVAELQEIILVKPRRFSMAATPPSDQKSPADTQPIVGQGRKGIIQAENFNVAAAPPIKDSPYTRA